jgi:hypothetical protein
MDKDSFPAPLTCAPPLIALSCLRNDFTVLNLTRMILHIFMSTGFWVTAVASNFTPAFDENIMLSLSNILFNFA